MKRQTRISPAITGVLCGMLTLMLASPMLSACSDKDEAGQTEETSDSSDSPTADDGTTTPTVSVSEGDSTPTETEHELAPGEINLHHQNLTEEMIPSVPSLPDTVTQDSVKKAVLAIVADKLPTIPVQSVELLGSKTSDLPDGAGSETWASYLVKVGGGSDDLGIEVACSTQVPPVAKVKDFLRIDETQSYDVRNKKYVMNDNAATSQQDDTSEQAPQEEAPVVAQPEPLRNKLNPDDPYTYYDADGNLQPLAESSPVIQDKQLSYDDKGNPVWIYGSEDLG